MAMPRGPDRVGHGRQACPVREAHRHGRRRLARVRHARQACRSWRRCERARAHQPLGVGRPKAGVHPEQRVQRVEQFSGKGRVGNSTGRHASHLEGRSSTDRRVRIIMRRQVSRARGWSGHSCSSARRRTQELQRTGARSALQLVPRYHCTLVLAGLAHVVEIAGQVVLPGNHRRGEVDELLGGKFMAQAVVQLRHELVDLRGR